MKRDDSQEPGFGSPSLDEFLAAPVSEVARVAPATVILASGGTRRAAVMAGISSHSDEYVRWSHARALRCIELLFFLGVRHVFALAALPTQFREVGRYRDNLLRWLVSGIADPVPLSEYQRSGWRARLLCDEEVPELGQAAQRLRTAMPRQQSERNLWWVVLSEPDLPLRWMLTAAQRGRVRTREEAIRAVCGEDVPPATLFLSSGKPLVSGDLLPPMLVGQLQCYWRQRPGFPVEENELRTLFHDYAYLRATWMADKEGRAEAALVHRSTWEAAPTLGLGQRLGPFWYPVSVPGPASLEADPVCHSNKNASEGTLWDGTVEGVNA